MTGGTAAEVDELSVFNRRQAVGIGRLENMLNNYVEFAIQIHENTRKMILGQERKGAAELSLRKPIFVQPLFIQLFVSIQFSPDYANYMWTQSFGAFACSFVPYSRVNYQSHAYMGKNNAKGFRNIACGNRRKSSSDWLLAGCRWRGFMEFWGKQRKRP